MNAEAQPRALARNTAWNLIGFGLPVLVAVAAMPVLARQLDAPRFGLLAIAWLVHGYANELGFGRATTKFAAELERDDVRGLARVAWTTVVLQGGFGLVAGLVLLVATPLLVHDVLRIPEALRLEAATCFRLLGLTVPVIVTAAAVRGLLEALQRFDLVNAVRGPTSAANFALPVAGWAMGLNVAEIIGLLLAVRVAALTAYCVLCAAQIPALRQPAFAVAEVRRVTTFAGWTSLSSIASPLLIYLDRFLLGVLVSLAAVAYYAAPYEVVARLLIVPASIVGALFPELSRLHGQGNARRMLELAARGIRYTLLAVGPLAVLLIAVAPGVLRVWLGGEYAEAGATALRILAIGIVINAAAHLPISVLQGVGRPELPARFHLLEVPVHAVLAVVLISLWGVSGAAAAWTLRVSLDAGLLLWAMSWAAPGTQQALRAEGVPMLAAVLAALTAGAAAVSWIDGPWSKGLGVTLLPAGILWCLWQFGLRRSGKFAFMSWSRRAA